MLDEIKIQYDQYEDCCGLRNNHIKWLIDQAEKVKKLEDAIEGNFELRKGVISMSDYQKLDTPQLMLLDSELGFIIATEIDLSLINNGVILLKGHSYDYENGVVVKGNVKEISYSISENSRYDLDDNGKVID
jgi:hypothetical protein